MAGNGALERDFFVLDGKALTSGGSLNVTHGVLAVVDEKAITQNGRKVLSSFSNLPKDRVLSILLGSYDKPVSLSTTNKAWASQPFRIQDIEDLRVDAPKQVGIKVDDFTIGYNGKEGTQIVIGENTSTGIDVTLHGEAMYNLGYKEGKTTIRLNLQYPYVDADGKDIATGLVPTMQEIVEKAVEEFNQKKLLGGDLVTKYVDVAVVNSLNAALTGTTDYKYFTLTIVDNGDSLAQARVQAQYPTFKVVKTSEGSDESVYTILAPSATSLPAYTRTLATKIKVCKDCPASYTAIASGYVYSIAIEDDGANLATTIDDVPGFVTGSVVKVAQNAGVGIYTVVVTAVLTDAQIATFKAAGAPQATATFDLAGEVQSVCKNSATTTTAWVAGTEVCQAISETYSITVADNECGVNVLSDIQKTYPNLTITAGASALCQTTYTTTVLSNIVCPECSVEFRSLFETEAPDNYGLNVWTKADKTYNAAAKMGIRFTGKPFTMSGSENFRDEMPFHATSTKISIAGGQASYIAEGWNSQPRPFPVKVHSIAADPEALGGYLYNREDMARHNFDGMERLEGNNYGKALWGQESKVSGLAQYIQYTLTVRPTQYYKLLPHSSIKTNLNIIVELGRHEAVETLLNSLAGAAGLSAVQAVAK